MKSVKIAAVGLVLGAGAMMAAGPDLGGACPLSGSCTAENLVAEVTAPTQSVVEIAASNPDFSTLVAALKAADLVDALSGAGPFTVFAPTNEAFAKLPKGTLETLLKPENKGELAKILKFHVIPGKVLAADVVKLNGKDSPKTLEGSTFKINVAGGKVSVSAKTTATVVKTDIEGTNGVIHVLDTVILPGAASEGAGH